MMEIRQVFPIFEEGRLLKKDALDLIRDYAPDFFSLLFKNYGNGVIAGFSIRKEEGKVAVGPGILKHGDSFLCMRNEVGLPYDLYGQEAQVAIRKAENSRTADFRTEKYRITLGPVSPPGEELYELGRFRLERGAKLRCAGDYKDFRDLETEFNTLNLIHVKYACDNGSGLSPLILRLYGEGIIASPKAEPLDLSFATACLSGGGVSCGLVRSYLGARDKNGAPGEENQEWYKGLKRLYTRLVAGGAVSHGRTGTAGKTWID